MQRRFRLEIAIFHSGKTCIEFVCTREVVEHNDQEVGFCTKTNMVLILTLEHTGCGNSISKPQFLIHKGKDKSDRIWPPMDPSDIILIEASGEVS